MRSICHLCHAASLAAGHAGGIVCARLPSASRSLPLGVAGIILGLIGVHTGNPTVGEQKWYWLVTAISLLPLLVGFLLFHGS